MAICRYDAGSVLTRDAQRGVGGMMVHDHNIGAGKKHFERPPQA